MPDETCKQTNTSHKDSHDLEDYILQHLANRHKHGLIASFRWAFRGFYYAFRTQRNLRIELFIAAITIGFGFIYKLTVIEWSIILLVIFQVLGAELINTALEYTVDLYSKKFTFLAMVAKDVAAAFVLLGAIHALIQAVLIFGPKI